MPAATIRLHRPGAGRPRRRGRPPSKRQLGIWFTNDTIRRLSSIANARRVSVSSVIRDAVAKAI